MPQGFRWRVGSRVAILSKLHATQYGTTFRKVVARAPGYLCAAQSVTDTQVLDAFGNSLSRTGSTWPMPFGFVAKLGYQTDEDSGLMLLGHRFYDPSIGRFLSRDPIHAGPNDYAYCDNNPVTASIPAGKFLR